MPPSPDIGGRRWVKFAKYLKRNGHLVKIVAAHEHLPGVSPWINDGIELRDDINFINSSYPKYLGINSKTFKEKLLYKFSFVYVKLFCKGNYYDKSNHWKTNLIKTCRDLIDKYSIRNVICTIPPFRTACFLLELKEQFPQVNFMVDYRDPWVNNKSSFGFTNLKKDRFEYERSLEKKVIQGYDKIIAVSKEMGNHFEECLGKELFKNKFFLLPNGFDKEDFKDVKLKIGNSSGKDKIKIVFAGTFYDKSTHVLEKLMDVIRVIETKNPLMKGFLNFIFIGSIPHKFEIDFLKMPHSFTYLGKKSLEETYQIISEADFCSLFLTDDLNYSFSTKFYEYVALQKRIISFSRTRGANGNFIEEKNLGIAIDFDTMEAGIKKLYEIDITKKEVFNEVTDIGEFEIKNLTRKLEGLLIN